MLLKRLVLIFLSLQPILIFHWTFRSEPELAAGLGILGCVALLWVTEAIHITVTALLIPFMAVLAGVLDIRTALHSFSHPIIFLFLGGFTLAAALNFQKLDIALAQYTIRFTRGRLKPSLLMLLVVSSFLSMWVSNTATAAMMLPLLLGVLNSREQQQENDTTILFALLGLAYCCSVGGIATIIGTPPNAIAAAEAGIGFFDWLILAFPLTLILLITVITVLILVIKPELNGQIQISQDGFLWTRSRILTVGVFVLTGGGWIFSRPLSLLLGDVKDLDTLISIGAIVLLVGLQLVPWKHIEENTDWGELLLFGGGICLSGVLAETGSSIYLANLLSDLLNEASLLTVIAILALFVMLLTEFTSNTASAALLIPVFIGMGQQALDISPMVISALIAISASCAFILPIATPPNAIVYGSGLVPLSQMMRTGLYINMACLIVIVGYAALFW